jgi:hypothetical protein
MARADSYRRRVFFNYEKRIRTRSPPEKVTVACHIQNNHSAYGLINYCCSNSRISTARSLSTLRLSTTQRVKCTCYRPTWWGRSFLFSLHPSQKLSGKGDWRGNATLASYIVLRLSFSCYLIQMVMESSPFLSKWLWFHPKYLFAVCSGIIFTIILAILCVFLVIFMQWDS